jgi:hypothetical protein
MSTKAGGENVFLIGDTDLVDVAKEGFALLQPTHDHDVPKWIHLCPAACKTEKKRRFDDKMNAYKVRKPSNGNLPPVGTNYQKMRQQ